MMICIALGSLLVVSNAYLTTGFSSGTKFPFLRNTGFLGVGQEESNIQNQRRCSSHSLSTSRRYNNNVLLQMASTIDVGNKEIESPSLSSKKPIVFFNSLTRSKDSFEPAGDVVKMYTCGPTLYDAAHVGNFRAFLTYDIMKRVLTYFGWDVDHICNLTDVDDKIIKKCRAQDVTMKDLTDEFETKFFQDLQALNIVMAKSYPRATAHIDDMVQMIQDLHKKGYAYQSDEGSWYFEVGKDDGYGTKLVNLDVQGMKKGASGAGAQRGEDAEADEYDADKVGVRDFCLWKAFKPNFDLEEASWDTAIGKGRPGWHLECSAMIHHYFGDDTIDVHCGGIDLKFPHHENEIAQSEATTGKKFCQCWVHNGFVNIDNEKMSKSKGNFFTLREACPKPAEVRAYRYLVVSSQYRNPLSFTQAAMGAANGALKRLDAVRANIEKAVIAGGSEESETTASEIADTLVPKELANFETAIADDLSMPRATASLFALAKAAEAEFKRVKKAKKDKDENSPPLDVVGLRAILDAILKMDAVFGIFYEVPAFTEEEKEEIAREQMPLVVPDEVMKLVEERVAAKESQNWELADVLRGQIGELGFAVQDVKGKPPQVTKLAN